MVENWLVKILATGPGSNRSDFTERKRRRLKINEIDPGRNVDYSLIKRESGINQVFLYPKITHTQKL